LSRKGTLREYALAGERPIALPQPQLADDPHPSEATLIVGNLPEAAFTAGPHREIWQLISQHVADGKPFDPLILAWPPASTTTSTRTRVSRSPP
jgi:hypothetical protein